MPIPLIVGGISAATSLIAGHKQASAAKDAAKVQVASQDKAQAFNQQAFQQQQQAMQPYMQGGQDAFSQLMSQRQTGGLSAGMRGTAMPQGQFLAPSPQGPPQGAGPLGQAMGGPQGSPQMPQGAPMPQGGPQGQMVTVRAPTGEMARLPAGSPSLADALRKGAQQVQG